MHPQQIEPGIESLPASRPGRPARFKDALVIVLAFLGAQLALGLVLGGIAAVTSMPTTAALLGLLDAASIVVALWAASSRLRLRTRSLLPLRRSPAAVYVLAVAGAIGGALLLHPAERLLAGLLPVPRLLKSVFSAMINPRDIPGSVFLALIVAPIGEEILFRGVILRGFQSVYGNLRGLLFSALLFGAVHLNLYQFMGGFLLGLFLGWLFIRTGSLVPSVIAHAVYNGSLVGVGYLQRWLTGGAPGAAARLPAGFVSVASAVLGAAVVCACAWLVWTVTVRPAAPPSVRTVE